MQDLDCRAQSREWEKSAFTARWDVTDSDSIQQATKAGMERFLSIDVLVNNAGFGAYGPLEATSMETVRRQFDTNVIGLLETTKAVLPHFRAQHSGVIVNVSSIGGKVTFPLGTLYQAPSSRSRASASLWPTRCRRSA